MLKNLLVHIPSELPARSVVDGAVSLAAAHAAHVHAVSIAYEKASINFAVDVVAAVEPAFETEHERALTRANAALAAFETEARKAAISYALEPLAGLPAKASAAVGALARLHDLTIVPKPDSDYHTFDNVMPQQLLFQSGGPILFIPQMHKGSLDPKRIGIAWDGSRLASRAVRDAAPFLPRADAITIISINEAPDSPGASAAALAAHLARHDLTAKIERANADHADIQPLMLSIAADIGLDLFVMGGYSHGSLEELIMGGVTHGMLQSMTVPTLMSH